MPDDTTNGRTVRRLRREAGMSGRALAAALSLSPTYMCDMEHGRRHMEEEMFNRAIGAISIHTKNKTNQVK